MKDDFGVDINLMALKNTLETQDPYAVLVVSTTGINSKSGFDKHSPTRVQVTEFEFDDEMKQYAPTVTFDKLVAADIEAVNLAIERAEKGEYDAFGNAEIDVESYKAQIENPNFVVSDESKKVLSQEEFKEKFTYLMQALVDEGTTLIANGYKHAQENLEKIGCGEELQELYEDGKVIDQPSLGGEYLHSKGRDDLLNARGVRSATLEAIRQYLTPVPPHYREAVKVFENPEVGKDYKTLKKDEFLKKHTEVKDFQYEKKKELDERSQTKITAPQRVSIISSLVKKIGREAGLLELAEIERARQNEKQNHEIYSEIGKEKYKEATIEEKLETQEKMNVFNREAVMSGNSDYSRLMSAFHGDNNNKGVAFVHISTSGFNNPNGNKTGLPFVANVHVFDLDKEHESLKKVKGLTLTADLPKQVMVNAENLIAKGGFNIFEDAGVNLETYKNLRIKTGAERGKYSQEEFIKVIDRIFEIYKPEDYNIIVLGKSDGKAFFQKALESVSNLDVIQAPTIDLITALKDYSLLVSENLLPENVIFKDEQIDNFSINSVAKAMNKEINTAKDKLVVACFASVLMYKQYAELNKTLQEEKEVEDEFKEVEVEPPTLEEINNTKDKDAVIDDFIKEEAAEIEKERENQKTEKASQNDKGNVAVSQKENETPSPVPNAEKAEPKKEEPVTLAPILDVEKKEPIPTTAEKKENKEPVTLTSVLETEKKEPVHTKEEEKPTAEVLVISNEEKTERKKEPKTTVSNAEGEKAEKQVEDKVEENINPKPHLPNPKPNNQHFVKQSQKEKAVTETEPKEEENKKVEQTEVTPKETVSPAIPQVEAASTPVQTNVPIVSQEVQILISAFAQQTAEQNKVITKLAEINARQNETIAKQGETIAKQNEYLYSVLQQQNEIMKTAITSLANLNRPVNSEYGKPVERPVKKTAFPPTPPVKVQQPQPQSQLPDEYDVVDKLENIKESIEAICNEVPEAVKNILQEANNVISEGQTEFVENLDKGGNDGRTDI